MEKGDAKRRESPRPLWSHLMRWRRDNAKFAQADIRTRCPFGVRSLAEACPA